MRKNWYGVHGSALIIPLLVLAVVLTVLPATAQTLIGTVGVGMGPDAVAHNSVTNKIYVANYDSNNITVIDGVTSQTTTVGVGTEPWAIAVNPVTNKIYVVNDCPNPPFCTGTLTVIDGATNDTATLILGYWPFKVAVNTVTNKIYVTLSGEDAVAVIDGSTNQMVKVGVGWGPRGVAVNPISNKIYVANNSSNTVTAIDGATLATATIPVGLGPGALDLNSVTNKIYVVNNRSSTVTVIDGATNGTNTVPTNLFPLSLGVNQVTNLIYVASPSINTITIIDGATLLTSQVPVGYDPLVVAVDPVTDDIYVPNYGDNSMTMIDGTNNDTTTVPVGNSPIAIDVNIATNRIYVANYYDDTVSVIAGASATALQFVPVTPCRLVDTRPDRGGGGPIQGGTFQSFPIPQEGGCNIPATAAAYSLNVSVVPQGPLAYLTIWPTGEEQPVVATLNSLDGRIKANAAIVPAGYQGAISIYVTQTTNVILDINGYFAPVSGSTLAFYPLTPCRVADTRHSTYPPGLGPPYLTGGVERQFPILNAATNCTIPTNGAAAYSLNFSVVPHGALYYMTVWPTGESRPLVSTLNDIPGQIIANAAIVVAGTSGEVSVYPTNDTDLVIDINGYFAAAGPGGLSLYAVAPCRVIDTRHVGSGQPFSGTLTPPVDVTGSFCGPPATAQAYVFNASVVPTGALGYLTLWPDGTGRPTVSTLNALDGSITNNMAIVPSTNGKVDAYASGITQLILDISSYFAP
jgi:YVTN family beta-propeller protein